MLDAVVRTSANREDPSLIFSSLDNGLEEFIKTARLEIEGQKCLGTFEIEAINISGNPNELSEDAISLHRFQNSLIGAVYDGTTSLHLAPGLEQLNITGGRRASQLLCGRTPEICMNQSMDGVFKKLNTALFKSHQDIPNIDMNDVLSFPASGGTILRINMDDGKLEFGHMADTFAIAYYSNGQSAIITSDLNRRFDEEAFALMDEIANPADPENKMSIREARNDEKFKIWHQESTRVKINSNKIKGVGILNGQNEALIYLETGQKRLAEVVTIFMGSDGMIPPGFDIQDPKDRKQIKLILDKEGLRGLIKLTAEREKGDPDWNLYPRFKDSDDASGILIKVKDLVSL